MLDTIISVYTIITHRPFIYTSDFHVCNFTSSSSMDLVLIIVSSTYTSSHGQAGQNSMDRALWRVRLLLLQFLSIAFLLLLHNDKEKRVEDRALININPKFKLGQSPDKHPLQNQTPRYSFPASHILVNELDQVHQPLFYS